MSQEVTKPNNAAEPYIVSLDARMLLERWSIKAGYAIPDHSYFASMAADLASVLEESAKGDVLCVDLVGEKEIQDGMNRFAYEVNLPIVSLDRAYIDDSTPHVFEYLDVTRVVDEDFHDIGLVPRVGCLPIEEQLQRITGTYQGPVALTDDVVFSASELVKENDGLCDRLAKLGCSVKKIIAGIGVDIGVDRLRNKGIEVLCVREYGGVIDEVCERDFFASIPMSGRTLRDGSMQLWSAPYFRPFGHPEKWASVRADRVQNFSNFCLEQSIILWTEIERLSQASIPAGAAPRRIKGLREDVSIVRALKDYVDTPEAA